MQFTEDCFDPESGKIKRISEDEKLVAEYRATMRCKKELGKDLMGVIYLTNRRVLFVGVEKPNALLLRSGPPGWFIANRLLRRKKPMAWISLLGDCKHVEIVKQGLIGKELVISFQNEKNEIEVVRFKEMLSSKMKNLVNKFFELKEIHSNEQE